MVKSEALAKLPVGFVDFHRHGFLNYQFNRAHALGWARTEDLRDAAARVRTLAGVPEVFEGVASRAEREGRLRNATSCLRIAEFFTPQQSSPKREMYARYRDLFDRAFADSGEIRHAVPYGSASLPAYFLPALDGEKHGTLLLHGGFDSVIEEFFAIWERFAAAGYDVIAFEGPGQGGARTIGGLTFDHDWEKPAGAVLDHFRVSNAALVGLSMGGYWCLRAAGREPRIDRVVSWPPVFDWLYQLPGPLRGPTRWMLDRRGFMNWSISVRTRLSAVLRHAVNQALYLVDKVEPMAAADWFLGMNAEHLGSERVTQDVLLMCGEHDGFQPPRLTAHQANALTSARSVKVRTFTKAEHADSHCQMGNLGLACDVVTAWLRETGA